MTAYLTARIDARGHVRDPLPKILTGNSELFTRLVNKSHSNHPYLSFVVAYKNERPLPDGFVIQYIRNTVMSLIRAGLPEDRVLTLEVDHHDHYHGLVFRNLVTPVWPRFQPYFHQQDSLLFADFQRLINRRFGLLAPEDPSNTKLITIAGKHFTDQHSHFVLDLREKIETEFSAGKLQNHAHFLRLLALLKITIAIVQATDLEAIERPAAHLLHISHPSLGKLCIKGPLCQPHWKKAEFERKQEAKTLSYQAFLKNPLPIWNRFVDGVRKRRARFATQFPTYISSDLPDPTVEFALFREPPDPRRLPIKYPGSPLLW